MLGLKQTGVVFYHTPRQIHTKSPLLKTTLHTYPGNQTNALLKTLVVYWVQKIKTETKTEDGSLNPLSILCRI